MVMSDPSIFGLDNRWTCYAVEVVTGKMITELPLIDVNAQVRLLSAGAFTATLPLGHYEKRSDAQALLDVTIPGKYSVVLDLDGQIVGEWIIWKRSRVVDSDNVALQGSELVSLLEHRIMWAYSWTQTEQLDIATFLARDGFIGTPGTTALVRFPAYYPSGVKRDRSYVALDGNIGTRLRELSQVENGFDYWLHTFWDAASSLLTVAREFSLAYPRLGVDQPFTFELGRNLASAALDEDAVTLASRAFAIGATTDDVVRYGLRTSSTLTNLGYPLMDRSGSWTTVTDQFTIDSYAQALLNSSQDAIQPSAMTVYADVDPQFGLYALGDRVMIVSPPTNVFPLGVSRFVRIVGWDVKPDVSTPTTISLVIEPEG